MSVPVLSVPAPMQRGERPRPERAPGRPRSERANHAILQAALELVAERGYEGLTMEALAERAGVGKATVYRRWKSKQEVLTAAVASFVGENTIPDTGTIEGDLLHLLRAAVANYTGLPGRIMPGLVGGIQRDPALAHVFRTGFMARRRVALRTVMKRGIRRGEVREDIDMELALDFIGGALFFRLLISGMPIDDDLARGTVDMMLRGIAPR